MALPWSLTTQIGMAQGVVLLAGTEGASLPEGQAGVGAPVPTVVKMANEGQFVFFGLASVILTN
jgi:hypothetical protein